MDRCTRRPTTERITIMSNTPRVAIITGASQGIGEALVAGYRKLGYAVVANSRSIVASDDPMVLAVPGDIGQPGVGQRVVDAALEQFGRVDTIVNNAGIFIAKPFTEYTDEDYDAITGVNLRGFFEVTRAGIAAIESHGEGGHVVIISTSLVDQRGGQGIGDRVRWPRNTFERSRFGNHPHADAPAGNARVPVGTASGRPHG
jgi:NAD(P)-dependent dehydrogenase (short-subunit alcohol dehydrogenase family)